MIAGQIISALLLNDPAVSAIVGDRVHANNDPQTADGYPNIIFYCSGAQQQRTLNGPTKSCATDSTKILVQSLDYAQMVDLSVAVKNALQIQHQTVAGLYVQGIFFEDESEEEQNVPELGEDFIVQTNEQQFDVMFDLP